MTKKQRLKGFVVRLTDYEHSRLIEEAHQRNISGAELFRQSLKAYIDNYKIEEDYE